MENKAPSANAPVAQPTPIQNKPPQNDDDDLSLDPEPEPEPEPEPVSSCSDVQADHYSCQDQKSWGKCDASWMIDGNYCQKTCGRCQ